MKRRLGILTTIVMAAALLLAQAVKADGFFSLRIGFDSFPGYNNCPQYYWPGYYGNRYRPSFYFPGFYGYYNPFYYFYYPTYYYSSFYSCFNYRAVYPFYHAFYYPFYYPYFYPFYSYPYYSHYYNHGHHHPARPKKHRNQQVQQQINSSHPEPAVQEKRGSIYRGHTVYGRVLQSKPDEKPVSKRTEGRVIFDNGAKDKSDVTSKGRNTRIFYIDKGNSARRATSSSLPASVRVTSGMGRTASQTSARAKPVQRYSANTPYHPPPARVYGHGNYRPTPGRHTTAGMPAGNKQVMPGQPGRKTLASTTRQSPVMQRNNKAAGRDKQASPQGHSRRNDRQQAGDTGRYSYSRH